MRVPGLALLACLASCSGDPKPDPAGTSVDDTGDTEALPPETRLALEAPRLLRRLSLDLRGTLPTAAELDTVAADPAQV